MYNLVTTSYMCVGVLYVQQKVNLEGEDQICQRRR